MNHSIRTRYLASFVLTASVALALPGSAEAQAAPPTIIVIDRNAVSSEEEPRLTRWEARELESINAQSGWAKGLYISSFIGLAAAVPPAIVAGLFFMGCGSCMEGLVLASISGAVGGIAAILLPIAIGLDIDSGNRRRALLGPIEAQLSLGVGGVLLSGTF